jgi:hypothetical protein
MRKVNVKGGQIAIKSSDLATVRLVSAHREIERDWYFCWKTDQRLIADRLSKLGLSKKVKR